MHLLVPSALSRTVPSFIEQTQCVWLGCNGTSALASIVHDFNYPSLVSAELGRSEYEKAIPLAHRFEGLHTGNVHNCY